MAAKQAATKTITMPSLEQRPLYLESYQAHIKEKLSLKNAHELVQHAVRWISNHEHQ